MPDSFVNDVALRLNDVFRPDNDSLSQKLVTLKSESSNLGVIQMNASTIKVPDALASLARASSCLEEKVDYLAKFAIYLANGLHEYTEEERGFRAEVTTTFKATGTKGDLKSIHDVITQLIDAVVLLDKRTITDALRI
jgi:hypothetical protein